MNEMVFSAEQAKNGKMMGFVKSLIDMSEDAESWFFDIRITSDGESYSVSWCQRYYDFDYSERFTLVDESAGECVMRRFEFPDGSSTYVKKYDDFGLKDAIESYEEAYPNWKYDAITEQWQHVDNDEDNRKG